MAVNDFSEEASTPATPTTGRWKLYPKSTGWFFLDDAGVETSLTAGLVSSTKLPTVGCTQAAGELTFTAASMYLDFRSATLTSGTPSTVLAAPANLVLPSGGTLGFTTLIEGTIMIAEMNNAGTTELAICNKVGGLQTDESNLISTTAIGTGSDSPNVWYSTTARTNLPYKIIGEANITNTAGAWGDATKIQPAGGRALAYQMILATAQATTSGTSIDFTGIPSWVKRITVMLNGVSTNGTSTNQIQLGNGAIVTTGYVSTGGYVASANANDAGSSSSGLAITGATGAVVTCNGHVILSTLGSNIWVMAGLLGRADNTIFLGGGSKTLAGTLDRIRLTTVNGTDTFDAGSVNILMEG